MTLGILLDLDETLVRTDSLEPLRRLRRWTEVYRSLALTVIPAGTLDFVEALKPLGPAGVVTSAPRPYAEQLLRHHAITLPVLVAYHDTGAHKPAPAPLLEGARRLGIAPARCVHVGDAPGDEAAAHAAGMASILVSWGVPAVGACASWPEVLVRIRAVARQ